MPDLDIEAAANEIGADLGFDTPDEPETPSDDGLPDDAVEQVAAEVPRETSEVTPEALTEAPTDTPPQSWAKEKHEVWAKMPPEAKDYYRQREKQMLDGLEQYKQFAGYGRNLSEAFRPYQQILKSQGVDEVKAVQYLLNAHTKLSDQDQGKRTQYFKELAGLYNIDLGQQMAGEAANSPQMPDISPLLNKVNGIESQLQQWKQREYQAVQSKVAGEVEQFASDPKNVYFEELSEDIVKFINMGFELKDAYDKAVWANPLTRQKELARVQTEQAQQLTEKRKQEAEKTRKAISGNVRSRDTGKAPTEPLGSMEDTMREVLASRRTH